MIHLDTSFLVELLGGNRRAADGLRAAIERGERILLSTIVLYEWLRGPRGREELTFQEALFPREAAVPFGVEEAVIAATLYQRLRRARGREIDIAVAACAITHDAALWTLNPADFDDIPGLELYAAG
jgi:predicted nucleic acid-binding protein